jgi:cytochrome oxidase assembly protein ShyY1
MQFNFNKQKISTQAYSFKTTCSLLALLIILTSTSIMATLCIWQFKKGQYKKIMTQNYNVEQSFEKTLKNINTLNLSKVKVQTKLCNGNKLLLIDLQRYNNTLGYHVLLPCELHNNKNLLINLGWINSPQQTISYQKKFHNLVFTGYLKKVQHNPFIKQVESKNTFPKIVQGLEIDFINKIIDTKFEKAVLLLEEKHPLGFAKQWNLKTISWQRHYFYAAQWLVFALISLIMFIYVNTEKVEK